MNTPDKRVEEILTRFDAELFNDDGWNMRMHQETKDWLRTTLTQYHQDLMSDLVEELEGMKKESDYPYGDDIVIEHKEYNAAIDQAIALVEETFNSDNN